MEQAVEVAKQAAHQWAFFAAGIGSGLVVLGAAFGIGKLAAATMDASGRQPEVADKVRTAMLIAAGLIEGVTFFALVICIILATKS
ncbi:MAG: ATP synthase F0 subunit C [Bacteroidota bacterium]